MKRLLLSVAVAAIAFTGSAAYAQDADGTEIIVTAQRREQNVQDVGLAVSVLSGQQLLEQGVTTVNGLENLAPSLEVESQFGGGQPSYSLRGVGFRDYASNNAPTVGVYVDEVAYTLPIMTQGVLFDVERVEVLRGPQGTLYGRNTTGGAINVISARPRDEFAAGFNAEYGNYDAVRGEGYVNWALGGGAAARISGAFAQGGAWQTNRETGAELGDADRIALRGQFLLPATDNLEFLLNLHGFRDQSDGLGLILFKNLPATPAPGGPGLPVIPATIAHEHDQTSWGFSPAFAAQTGLAQNTAPFRDNEGAGASLTTRYDFGGATLTYILSHEHLDRRELNDWDALPLAVAGTLFTSEASVTQNEIRLASNGDNAFDWIVGVYFGDEELTDNYESDFGDSFGPIASLSTPYSQEVDTAAIFAQIEYQVAPTLNLVAGIRYEDEERRLVDFTTNFAGGAVIPLQNNTTEMQEVSGRVALEWTPTDDLLYYASISRGVKSGGFTAYNSFSPDAVDAFDPEVLVAYEVGFKSELIDRTLRLNGALFYYDYTDQQVQNALFIAANNAAVGRITNAPSSRIYGAELELVWRPIEALTITQAIGYQNGEFDEDFLILDIAASNASGTPVGRNANGERLGPPELTYNGSLAYQGAVGANWEWSGSVDYSYRGETDPPLLKPTFGEGYGVPDYWLVNANLSVRPTDGPWEFGLWGRNLLDEEYHETRNFFAAADVTPIAAPGLPRTFGVRVAYRR